MNSAIEEKKNQPIVHNEVCWYKSLSPIILI
jgi:hypothetical protein